jgi:3'-phosphoadenosine 5'-phosphosulfate (PAPS) 3'-phosphatase
MDYQKIIELVKKASETVFDPTLKSEVATKGEADFVTAVDLKISNFIKEELKKLDPNA